MILVQIENIYKSFSTVKMGVSEEAQRSSDREQGPGFRLMAMASNSARLCKSNPIQSIQSDQSTLTNPIQPLQSDLASTEITLHQTHSNNNLTFDSIKQVDSSQKQTENSIVRP